VFKIKLKLEYLDSWLRSKVRNTLRDETRKQVTKYVTTGVSSSLNTRPVGIIRVLLPIKLYKKIKRGLD